MDFIFFYSIIVMDIWSIGCILAEMLIEKPLFPGRNALHQLDLFTDLLGFPSAETIARIRYDKARRYLNGLPNKTNVPLSHKFPNADPLALRLLKRFLAFDPADRLFVEALADPYHYGLANLETGPSKQPISKLEFEFEKRRLTKNDVRELIYREVDRPILMIMTPTNLVMMTKVTLGQPIHRVWVHVYCMAPFATMILAVPALLLEGAGVVEWIQTNTNILSAFIIIIGLGVTAFYLNFSIFDVIHSTATVTFNIAENLNVLLHVHSTSHCYFRRKRNKCEK